MRRHVLIARLGAGDRVAIAAAADEVVTGVSFIDSKRRLSYGLGDALASLNRMKVYPSEVGIDLALLAAMVQGADTRISRSSESQDSWTREIRLVVPVSDTALWTPLGGLVETTLNFLTGDRWCVGFRPRPPGFERMSTRPPSRVDPPFEGVSLFSGGADSFVGAIDRLASGASPLFVSHASDGATSDAQNQSFQALREAFAPRKLARVRAWVGFSKKLVNNGGTEDTTRGRSFLFFALGALAASGLPGSTTLYAPENGLIALNVPLDVLRLGSNSTRTMHPYFVRCSNELLRRLGMAIAVVNPYWNRTKGEMMKNCSAPSILAESVPKTMSCSAPTKARWQGRGIEHCGYCLPCLIRRAAIQHAYGPRGDSTTYTLADLQARVLDSRKAEGEQVRSFELAIARLKA